ncbi:MAG: hypothetical protein WC479_05845 [Candidatus Izemoplasmatales bacterium]
MSGYLTTDGVDLNEVYYNTVVPSISRYNNYDFFPFRETLCSDGDESYIKFPLDRITFDSLGEAEVPSAKKLKWGRFIGTTSKTGAAFGYTMDFLKDASSRMINDVQAEIYAADRNAVMNKVLNVCLDSASSDGFYNTYFDSESDMKAYSNVGAPPAYGQNTFTAAHTHYVPLNSTSIALTDITSAKHHIAEHGSPSKLVAFINSEQVEVFENLAGWNYSTTATYLIPNPITDKTAIDGFQTRWLGIDFFQTEAIPAGYVLIVDVGTGGGYDKPVKFIEPKNASFRGLQLLPGNAIKDYPIIESYFLRWMGAKVWKRAAGIVLQAKSGTTYSAPTLA